MDGQTTRQVRDDEPLMVAWKRYAATSDFANTAKWAAAGAKYVDGSLWAAFLAGYVAATTRAGDLHESINPASDMERLCGDPGAGAMGAVIEYRDTIRDALPLPSSP